MTEVADGAHEARRVELEPDEVHTPAGLVERASRLALDERCVGAPTVARSVVAEVARCHGFTAVDEAGPDELGAHVLRQQVPQGLEVARIEAQRIRAQALGGTDVGWGWWGRCVRRCRQLL